MYADPTKPTLDLGRLRIDRPKQAGPEPRRTRLLIAAGLAVVIGTAAFGARVVLDRRMPTVRTAYVEARTPGQPSTLLTGSGYIVTSHKYITIGTKILGQIVEEPIQEGQYVRKGDVLARIDDRDYQAQLRQAEANREIAEANLRLRQAKAARSRNLRQAGVVSEDEYETTQNLADVAQATLKSDVAAVDYAKFMVGQCVIRSPIDGIVLQKYREVGDTINYGGLVQTGGGATDIAQLADTGDMRAQVDINESDIANLAPGSAASVVLDAYRDRSFDASLVKIYPEADRQKGTVRVEVHIARPDLQIIKPEMGAKVSFLTGSAAGVPKKWLSVPKNAVSAIGQDQVVWVVRDGSVHRQVVTTGRVTELDVEIRSGLGGGEQIVLGTTGALRDGEAVKVATSPTP